MTPTRQAASDAFFRALASHNPSASLFHSLSPQHREMMEELLREYVRHWHPTQPNPQERA